MDADVWSFLLCIVTGLLSLVKCELSAEECLQLGLRKSDLMCSWCDQLVKHDLDVLVDSCHQCCGASGSKDPIKSDRPHKFPGLKIKYVRGADPVIKMFDGAGHVQEELSIQKWDTDTVEEFLRGHLE